MITAKRKYTENLMVSLLVNLIFDEMALSSYYYRKSEFCHKIARVFWLTYSKRVELKATAITKLFAPNHGVYYWLAKINGVSRKGSFKTKSMSVAQSKLWISIEAAKPRIDDSRSPVLLI